MWRVKKGNKVKQNPELLQIKNFSISQSHKGMSLLIDQLVSLIIIRTPKVQKH